MRTKLKQAIALFSTFCVLNTLAAGCSLSFLPAAQTENDKVSLEKLSDTPPADAAKEAEQTGEGKAEAGEEAEAGKETEAGGETNPQENDEGKWHVLDKETAAAVDADFVGTVWHIAEGAFSIAETKMQILEDGSISSSAPSSNAPISDSDLIHVAVDDDTYFYTRTIQGNGESYEDAEAGFQDLAEHVSVEMKGRFENDVFYAAEIRIIKFS